MTQIETLEQFIICQILGKTLDRWLLVTSPIGRLSEILPRRICIDLNISKVCFLKFLRVLMSRGLLPSRLNHFAQLTLTWRFQRFSLSVFSVEFQCFRHTHYSPLPKESHLSVK